MVAPLGVVVVKRPEDAYRSTEAIDAEWEDLGYLRRPKLLRASHDHQEFVSFLEEAGAKVLYLPTDKHTGLDSLYTHDPVLVTDAGAIILQTGKQARRGEGPAFRDALEKWGVPIIGSVDGHATAEAGDMVWLDSRTLLVGHGFRTNKAGIEQLQALLQTLGVTIIPVQLPYWEGPRAVLHLMSFMSLLDENLAVVYRRLMPVPLFEELRDRSIQRVDVPHEEHPSLGSNVLAVFPRNVVMVRGNPVTRSRLEDAGCEVFEFDGSEICIPGAGGPTCLTRPL